MLRSFAALQERFSALKRFQISLGRPATAFSAAVAHAMARVSETDTKRNCYNTTPSCSCRSCSCSLVVAKVVVVAVVAVVVVVVGVVVVVVVEWLIILKEQLLLEELTSAIFFFVHFRL